MVSGSVRFEGAINRIELEAQLSELVATYQVVRLKGRVWLPGKALPLQVQMVGPRLNSWFEAAPAHAWRPVHSGVDLVVLSFDPGAERAIRDRLSC